MSTGGEVKVGGGSKYDITDDDDVQSAIKLIAENERNS